MLQCELSRGRLPQSSTAKTGRRYVFLLPCASLKFTSTVLFSAWHSLHSLPITKSCYQSKILLPVSARFCLSRKRLSPALRLDFGRAYISGVAFKNYLLYYYMVLSELIVPERGLDAVLLSSRKFKMLCRELSSSKEESTIEFLCSWKLRLREIGETPRACAI